MKPEILLISELFKKYNLAGDIHRWAHENKFKIFGIPYHDNLTFDEWLEMIEDDSTQRTVVLSARISYDIIKYYFSTCVNQLFSKITECDLKVVSVKDAVGADFLSSSFDLILSLNGQLVPFEIKFTQDHTTFSGSTHSTNKVKNYLLFHFETKRNVKINSNEDFFNTMFMMATHFNMDKWVGEAKKGSSFTTFKLPSNIDYSGQVIFGKLKKNKVWCRMMPSPIELTK